jgi:hypothetical protein
MWMGEVEDGTGGGLASCAGEMVKPTSELRLHYSTKNICQPKPYTEPPINQRRDSMPKLSDQE